MHNRFDHLAKEIGRAALGPSGSTTANEESRPEIQYADLRHEPNPARKAERARLGLLGRLAAFPCLIEAYSRAPNAKEFRACLAKHLAFWQHRARKRRSGRKKRSDREQPFLWILAAGAPATLLTQLKLEPAPGWPAGVYFFGADVLRVGIVVASELPRDRATVLVRLMTAGPPLAQAIEELRALPTNAHERVVAERILLKFQSALGHKPRRTPKEQEFIVAMLKSWEEGRAEARAEGRAEARADDVLTALRVRGIAVPEAARKRILAQKDLQRLERWLERAIVATSLREVLDDGPLDRSSKTGRPAANKERNGRRPARAPVQR